jgi:GNAT superfamily N-acetyltransferase
MKKQVPEVRLRRATIADIGKLTAMARKMLDYHIALSSGDSTIMAYLKPDRDFDRIWKGWVGKWIRSANGMVIIAESRGKPIGYAMGYIKKNTPIYSLKELGYIGDLYVEKNFRRSGVGTMMKDFMLDWFRKRKMRYVSIAVHESNSSAHKAYASWGFSDYYREMRQKL